MKKKVIDHGPMALGWGILIGWVIGYYYPKDASWWQDALLWIGIMLAYFIIIVSWLPGPDKREKDE